MAILFDLDGVFYQGDSAIAGAADVASWAREQAVPHLYLTNTTSRPRSALLQKLATLGVVTDIDHLLTPAVAAVRWCQSNIAGQRVALFVPQATRVEFAALPDEDSDGDVSAVIVGDMGRGWDFETLNRAFRLLMQSPQPRLLALGMTRYWRAEDGLQLDVAPFVMALSHAANVEPLVLGKPAASFYQAAVEMLGVARDQVVMVGDDIRGDIEGALKAGLHAVLVRTGKFRAADLALGVKPTATLDSVADLPAWYASFRETLEV